MSDLWKRVRAAEKRAEEAERKLTLIENFCESHRPFASEKSEVVIRRVLWTIRGSNDDPPARLTSPGEVKT